MTIPGLHVAFIHDFLGLGGAETVSRDTGELFVSLGVYSHYYCMEFRANEWSLPDPSMSSVEYFPNKERLWSEENVDYLLSQAKEHQIKVFIIPIAHVCPYWDKLKAADVKVIYWSHGAPFWEEVLQHPRLKVAASHSLKKKLEWVLFRSWKYNLFDLYRKRIEHKYREIIEAVDRFITLCPEYSEEIAERLHLSEELKRKLIALPNTLPIQPTPQLAKSKRIVFMGRLCPESKVVSRLLRIWALIERDLPDWSLDIYGKGPEEPELRRLMQEFRLERAELKGYCSEPNEVYKEAAIVVLTSTLEGIPLTLLEAQNNGCVPMAFGSCAGIRYVIGKDKEYGRLAPPYDLKLYAERLEELCTDDALRARLQEACLRKRLDYAPEQNAERWRTILENL